MIRRAKETDLNLVRKTWIDSYKKANCNHVIYDALYYNYYHEVINNIIKDSAVLISADENDPDNILSYIVFEPGKINILHYGFTKTWFRKMGFFWELINLAFDNDDPIFCTFMTRDFLAVKGNQSNKLNAIKAKGEVMPKDLMRWFWFNPFYINKFKQGADHERIDYGADQSRKRDS